VGKVTKEIFTAALMDALYSAACSP
jgi:hypothetical protein